MLVQLEAVQRFEPPDPAIVIAQDIATIKGAASLMPDQVNSDLNGIAQGLQQIEQQNQGNPHNGLVGTIVNELNDYITAHGGTPGPTPGGGTGGGTPA